ENERQMNAEVKALKAAGDESGAFEAKQKGLAKQTELSEKAIEEQRKVVKLMADEFGDSANETEDAKRALEKLERQSQISSRQLEALKSSSDQSGKKIEDFGDRSTRSARKLDGLKDKLSSLKSAFSFGAVAGLAHNAISSVVSGVQGLVGEAVNASDSLMKFSKTMEFANFGKSQIESSKKEMKDYADKTVYGLEEILNTTAQLASNGIPNYTELTKAAGNLNAVAGGSSDTFKSVAMMLTQTAGAGKLTTENWNQLADAIPGASGLLQDAMLKNGAYTGNFRDAMAQGQITSDEFNQAIVQLGMKDYADKTVYGLEEILNTTAQLASNGIPNYTELTKAAGNLNAVAGGSSDTFKSVAMMLTQTAGAGKLTTENWNQLADAIPGASGLLQDAMLKNGAYTGNFRDAMAQGQITSDEFNQAIVQLGMNDGAVKAATSTDTLSGSWEQMKSTVINGLQSIIDKVGVENITGFINRITKGIENSIPKITQFIGWLRDIGTWIVENREPLTWIVGIIGGITLAVKALNVASMLLAITGGTLAAPFVAIGVALGALAGALVIAYTKSETFRNIVNAAFTAVKNVVMSVINNLVAYYKMLWGVLQWLWEKIKEWASWIGNKFIEMKNSVVNTVQNLWNGVKNFFSNGVGDTWNKVVGWVKNIFNKATELKNKVSNVIGNLWNGIKDTFRRGIDTVFNWFSELPKKMKDAIIGGKNAIVDAFKSIFNAALKAIGNPVNAIIHGASWVLEKLGAEPLQEWDVPQYAKGTPNGGHPGGPMMVNDGRGAEAVITPNGQAFIPRGRNVVLNAPKGTHVLTAEETAYMTGNKAPRYRYAKGTGFFGNLWNNVKGFAGDVGNKLKDVVGDVWDFVTDPGALARKVLNGLGVLEGLVKYPLDVGKGILSKATEALTNKITELFSSGSLDTSMGMQGVYKYLADVAVAVMKKFPGFVATSGYRPGDPYSHGKRNAIDIALPGVTGGSPRYTEAANYAFEKFANKIGYVITNGKVRDRSGQSGTGIHNDWRPWPDGDHYDHVHLNGVKDPQNTQISGDSVGGSGVERWRNVAIRALKMTGQYSTANLNALLNQMRTESNGNPNAVNNWDINAKNGTPSKGLLQVIDPTFRQYAMPGFNSNIFDPLSNILASIRYALSRYGSLTNAYRGVGYANGGIVNQHQIAEIAEGNKPEIIIPLDKAKRSRAMQLLAIAQDKLGVKPKSVNDSSDSSGTLETLVSLMIQQNNLLSKLLAKDTSVKLDGKAIADNTNGYLGNQLKRSLYTTG
ncbi:tape measure protein, partial [Enterococcus faecium]|nr:tape measure protein [Enterococcus faecium]